MMGLSGPSEVPFPPNYWRETEGQMETSSRADRAAASGMNQGSEPIPCPKCGCVTWAQNGVVVHSNGHPECDMWEALDA